MINAISRKLYELFKIDNIYSDSVEQGLNEPCFFIKEINSEVKDYRAERKRVRKSYCITYLSDKDRFDGLDDELIEFGEKLLLNFEIMEDLEGNKYRAIDREIEIVDSQLNFYFKVDVMYLRKEESEKMEVLIQKCVAR